MQADVGKGPARGQAPVSARRANLAARNRRAAGRGFNRRPAGHHRGHGRRKAGEKGIGAGRHAGYGRHGRHGHVRAIKQASVSSAPTTRQLPPGSTTWRCSTKIRASTPRPSRFTSGHWRSSRSPWGPSTPTWPRAWRTTPPCCVRPDAPPMRQRWKPAPGGSGPKHAERNPAK